ncbi:hypothetical protein [Actinokineospora sp.]|uniref:hypothetical protein n=1 Tax=Actinokineospora sp. TaxID=1872133 RepID=UPI00403843DF
MTVTATLTELVGDAPEFLRGHWNRGPARFRADLPELITEREILDTVACGLLSWPYVTVVRDGVPARRDEVTVTRRVLNVTVPGFVHRRTVVEEFRGGATIELAHAEHWQPRIRAVVEGLAPAFGAEVAAAVRLTPAGAVEPAAHTGRAHAFVLQLAGETEWTAAGDPPLVPRPGEVLYLPHGRPRTATATGGTSLRVAITVEEPDTADIVAVLARTLVRRLQASEEAKLHHRLPAERKADWVRDEVARCCAELDLAAVLDAAVERRTSRS